jgi:hypothetical protein
VALTVRVDISPGMFVEHAPGRTPATVWDTGQDLLCAGYCEGSKRTILLRQGVLPVGQRAPHSAPAVFENRETFVVGIAAAEIEYRMTTGKRILDGLPE